MSGPSSTLKNPGRHRYWRWVVIGAVVLAAAVFEAAGPSVNPIVKIRYDNQVYYAPNQDFFREVGGTTPEPKGAWDNRMFMVPLEKPKGVVRIAVFGESAAIGEPPDSAVGFWRILDAMLRAAFPDRTFEVLPMAHSECDSYSMYLAAKAAAVLHPDFYLFYMGNNEVTCNYGVINRNCRAVGSHVWPIRVWQSMEHSRTVRIAGSLLQAIDAAILSRASFDPDLVMKMMASLDPRGKEISDCMARFRKNYEDMCGIALANGARAVLCTMAVDLRDWEPFYSRHPKNWTPENEREWGALMEQGRQLEDAGKHAEALEVYGRCLRLDCGYAHLQFAMGRCNYKLGRMGAASEHFVLARECDGLQARANNDINGVIRGLVGKFARPEVMLADAEKEVAEASAGGIPGWDMFYDCMHMQFEGSYRVARSAFESIAASVEPGVDHSPATLEECAERLALTPETRLQLLKVVKDGLLKDMQDTLKGDWHAAQLGETQARLEKETATADKLGPRRALERALQFNGEDHVLQTLYLYLLTENNKEALEYAKRITADSPPHRPQRECMAILLLQMGYPEQSLATLEKLIPVYPKDPDLAKLAKEARQACRQKGAASGAR